MWNMCGVYLIAFTHNHIIQARGITTQLQGNEMMSIPAQRLDGNISCVLKKKKSIILPASQ